MRSRGLASAAAWTAAFSLWFGCTEESFGPHQGANRAPIALGEIPPAYQNRLYGLPAPEVAVWPYFRDPDGDSLTFTATTDNPEVLEVTVSDGFVRASLSRLGRARVIVTATDPGGRTAEHTFESGQIGPGLPPVTPPGPIPLRVTGEIPSTQVRQGQPEAVDLRDHFEGGLGTTFIATSFSPETVTAVVSGFTLILEGLDPGSAAVAVTATSVRGQRVEQQFVVVVDPPAARHNTAPRFRGSRYRKVIPQRTTFAVDVSQYFSDPDGDPLTYAAKAGASLEASVSGNMLTVVGMSTGRSQVALTATDEGGLPVSGELMVEVTPPVRR